MPGSRFSIEVRPRIPERLARLNALARDLRYSWDRPTVVLFQQLDPRLWDAVGHNPKVFLRRVDERRLAKAAEDAIYIEEYERVLSRYDAYVREQPTLPDLQPDDLIAYFSAEFGLHESVQIYSGGLGILAGDHCKAASDIGVPFVGVGLLYRQGYFWQTIDGYGNQIATYRESDFDDLPIEPARAVDGSEARVRVFIGEREIVLRVWAMRAGRVRLLLLDSDLEPNASADRAITYQLYGGTLETRIAQEMALGIGGVRALRAVGLTPTVWHVNEGHAAFSVLERCRELVAGGVAFDAALEACAACTVFTTHTPVPAGHDIFPAELVDTFAAREFGGLGIDRATLLSLGAKSAEGEGFNQTALALRGSRRHNGVSRIHRDTSAQLCADMWPDIPPDESPISSVTNGVHVATFLAHEFADLFDASFGPQWRSRLSSIDYWRHLDDIPDHMFWSVRQTIKARLLRDVRERYAEQGTRNGLSDSQIDADLALLDPDDPNVLLVGFARRFATYKRADLLFADLERLARLVRQTDRPVVFLFAGKAHPADQPAQDLMRWIFSLTRRPELEGRALLLEGYDMSLARLMTAGVDVWLNTPQYPLEASGTSGQKAGMNGVINVSVLDGWWGEGYDGHNGWAIRPFPDLDGSDRRRAVEADSLYDIFEQRVVPLYYSRGDLGYSAAWVAMSKRSMRTLLPRFNATRMVEQYVRQFYVPAARHGKTLAADGYAPARDLAHWKARVRDAWPGVVLRRIDEPVGGLTLGSKARIEVGVRLNGLRPDDVRVECLLAHVPSRNGARAEARLFDADGEITDGEHRYTLTLAPDACGLFEYQIRAYPYHANLAHRFETGLLLWL